MRLSDYIRDYMPVPMITDLFNLSTIYFDGMTLEHREFSFTSPTNNVQRYRSFKDADNLRRTLLAAQPQRFDVGALYTTPLKFFKLGVEKTPVIRELTIDIDIDAYDSVRECSCARQPKLCRLCWRFLASAVRVLEIVLERVFNFTKLFWEFSGRRGIHCWIFDEEAVCAPEKFRLHFAEFFSPFKNPTSFHFQHQYPKLFDEICDDVLIRDFECLIETRVINPTSYNFALCLLEAAKLGGFNAVPFVNHLIEPNEADFTPLECWRRYCTTLEEQHPRGLAVIRIVVLSLLFPRIDKAVTKTMNHLLKVPFSWHSSTKTICVPFHSFAVDEFPIDQLPNLETGQNFEHFHSRFVRPLQDFLMPFTYLSELYLCCTCLQQREFDKLTCRSLADALPMKCHPESESIVFARFVEAQTSGFEKSIAVAIQRQLYQTVKRISERIED